MNFKNNKTYIIEILEERSELSAGWAPVRREVIQDELLVSHGSVSCGGAAVSLHQLVSSKTIHFFGFFGKVGFLKLSVK